MTKDQKAAIVRRVTQGVLTDAELKEALRFYTDLAESMEALGPSFGIALDAVRRDIHWLDQRHRARSRRAA